MLRDECREAELKELEKEWVLSDDWMLGLLSDDCREGLLSVLCRDARRPEEAKQRGKTKDQSVKRPRNNNFTLKCKVHLIILFITVSVQLNVPLNVLTSSMKRQEI